MTEAEATIDPKDITPDIIIDDTERPDRGGPEAAGGPAKPQGDHPVVTVLDMAVKQSGEFLRKQNLPPANMAVYESFSKPFLNEACWHYLPDGGLPDDPRFALVLGVAGWGWRSPYPPGSHRERRGEEKSRAGEKEGENREERGENTEETQILSRYRDALPCSGVPGGSPGQAL